jgi:flagellar assembly protein FliH
MTWPRLAGVSRPAKPPGEDPAPHAVCRESVVAGRGGGTEIDALQYELACLRTELSGREDASRKQGWEAGRAEGLREGKSAASAKAVAAAKQEYQDALGRAVQSVKEILESRAAMRKQMEEDLVHLAIAVARRILHRELQVDPEALTGIVKAVVERVEAREVHRLLVAPFDLPFIQKRLAELGLPSRVELSADSSLVRGSVVLETARGRIDASVETQLSEIERGFADLVRRS